MPWKVLKFVELTLHMLSSHSSLSAWPPGTEVGAKVLTVGTDVGAPESRVGALIMAWNSPTGMFTNGEASHNACVILC